MDTKDLKKSKSSYDCRSFLAIIACLFLASCFGNNPHPEKSKDASKTLYMSYQVELPFMDPCTAYNTYYNFILSNIYEPPFEFHYLKRPVELQGRTAVRVPSPIPFDKNGQLLNADANPKDIARVDYIIEIKKGILYQDHPCFAQDANGKHLYHLGESDSFSSAETPDDLLSNSAISTKTREVTAADYVYQIKRLANPMNSSPIIGVLEDNISGFNDLRQQIAKARDDERARRKKLAGLSYSQSKDERQNPIFLNMNDFDFKGIQQLDKYRFKVSLKKNFPQIVYWFEQTFFAPIPWEAQRFYRQHAAAEKNWSLDSYPVGSGPYKVFKNKSNYQIILTRNENFRDDLYPSVGTEKDKANGLLDYAGKKMPFVDRVIFKLDREGPPRWTKFMQGYYDLMELTKSDSELSNQVMELTQQGGQGLSPEMSAREINLDASPKPFIRYYSFNMADPQFGGLDESQCKLRQAITIAINMEQYIQIFQNGRGNVSHGIIPKGIFGILEGKDAINPYAYEWNEKQQKAQPLSIEYAQKLMREAGYENGLDKNGQQLVLHYDLVSSRSVKSKRDWLNKQLKPLGIRAEVRETDSNRWREKVTTGSYQFIDYGWYGDYPDTENFAFLLYGPNGKAKHGGENYANYDSPRYNELFQKMEAMPNGPKRLEIIQELLEVSRHDAPWIFAWEPSSFALNHSWLKNYKARFLGGDCIKYLDVDEDQRLQKTSKWNRPVTWPVYLFIATIILLLFISWRRITTRRSKGLQL